MLGGAGQIAVAAAPNRIHAIGAGPEIDPVEVEFENFRLGMLALQPEREFDFLQFSLQRALLRQKQILGEVAGSASAPCETPRCRTLATAARRCPSGSDP